VSEQEKKYRPLFEAIMAKTNGLDILAEITGEKAPEEKRPEERKEAAPVTTDTFGGMLQSLPMLVMLPAIMPLLQQMLTQTLAASTVNVKVESATTILPIEISASTAIVPIEIKASSVTLNVNIAGSNVTLNVNITGSVPLNVNIVEPKTLTVYIDEVKEGVVFHVNIEEVNPTITFNIHIESIEPGVTFNIHIESVEPTLTLNIHIESIEPGIIFNIHIESVNPNITFNVSVVGTVNVTGTVSISGTVNVTGTVSISGTVNVTGTVSISGTVNATIIGTVNVNITNQVVQTANPKPCLSFNGVNNYVKVPNSASLGVTSAITIEAWVNCGLSPTGTYAAIVRKEGAYALRFYGDGRLNGIVWIGGVAYETYRVPASDAWVPGKWVHWVFTYDGSYLRIYKNGSLYGSPVAQTGTIDVTTTDLGVGATGTGAMPFLGLIGPVRIYNRALSDSEIQYNYNNPESPVTNGLVLWLKMDEGSGTIVHDYSGNGNNGTIYGATWVSSVGSAPAAINVNVTASQVTFNMNIQAQSVDIQLTETYWTMRGYDKVLSGWDYVTPVGGVYYNYVIEYTVPSGKKLVVYAIDITLEMMRYASSDEIASRYPTAGWYPTLYTYGDDVEVELMKGTTVLAMFECRPTSPHLRYEFKVPKIYNAGDVLRIWAHAKLGYSLVEVTVYGVELAT
jgi:hypothetical protein